MATAASGTGGNARFNAEAAAWDSNPMVHQASACALTALVARFPRLSTASPPPTLDVLEIGCGTGLLTFLMAPYVRGIVAVDAAQGMIDVLEAKRLGRAEYAPVRDRVAGLCVLLEDPEDAMLPPAAPGAAPGAPRRKFDLITSHLVLHHIADLRAVLTTMLGCLKPGGSVALTDFQDFGPEARRFHPESRMDGVERHGIEVNAIEKLMKEVGFEHVKVEVGWEMKKDVEKWKGEWGSKSSAGVGEGEKMTFPFLVCMGMRA